MKTSVNIYSPSIVQNLCEFIYFAEHKRLYRIIVYCEIFFFPTMEVSGVH